MYDPITRDQSRGCHNMQHNGIQHNNFQHNDIQHNNRLIATLSIMALDAECCYADCHLCWVSQISCLCGVSRWMSLCRMEWRQVKAMGRHETDATTFRTTTLNILTFSLIDLIATLSITTLGKRIECHYVECTLLCWTSLCWVSLCWVSLCWMSLCCVSWCYEAGYEVSYNQGKHTEVEVSVQLISLC
jgi:hypothetical protein